MGFLSYCMNLSLYIMSSCLRRYSIFMNLILQMHAGQRSMCGVIVVDAESFRSTCLGRDAYIKWSCLDSLIIIRFSINCSTVICLPAVEYRYHERSHQRTLWPPGLFSTYQSTSTLLFLLLLSVLLNKNTKNINYHLYQISLS